MRLKTVTLVAVIICGCVTTLSFAEMSESELRARIDAANALIDEASIKHDYETIARFYTEDVIVLPNHEPVLIGRDAVIGNEKASEQAGFKILEIESSITKLFRDDRLVHEIGTYKVKLSVPGAPYPITDRGNTL